MKIGNSPESSVNQAKAERTDKTLSGRKSELSQPIKAPPLAPVLTPSTQVEISKSAQIAASAGADDGSFDAAKVDRISKAITEGKFTINASAIADKLVANAQELLDARANKH
ncbi:flagellar biosynthesis anti-sigma factor FlgM [Roseateles sp.]|jgi:negative regulator of flagellin synthesis FlgM|uniref:flagellar biosynthesis anti-sigma factor FlgM n=1 Tax=Roseateles sp. TaxID=1971397 RepID=UPI003BA85891